jgi:hypothetical protein
MRKGDKKQTNSASVASCMSISESVYGLLITGLDRVAAYFARLAPTGHEGERRTGKLPAVYGQYCQDMLHRS